MSFTTADVVKLRKVTGAGMMDCKGALADADGNFERAVEIIREKGTDRSKFFRGQVDKYSWCDLGSSYLPSELNAAYLWAQLEIAEQINNDRLTTWNLYNSGLQDLAKRGDIELPFIPEECTHNAHMFYIKTADLATRSKLIEGCRRQGILSVFHYVPLHSSKAGLQYGEFVGDDKYTTKESERILRLPMYYGLKPDEIASIQEIVYDFFG